jgi:hypothetical protein
MRNGIVYKISCNFTGEIYIGSTFQPIRNRIAGHKNKSNTCTSKKIIDRGNYSYCSVFEGLVDDDLLKAVEKAIIRKSANCVNRIYKQEPASRDIKKISDINAHKNNLDLKLAGPNTKPEELAAAVIFHIFNGCGEVLNSRLNDIFGSYYNLFCLFFGKRQYTRAELVERKLQYKLKFVNAVLARAGYQIKKENEIYFLCFI